jgi:hypothetical protein
MRIFNIPLVITRDNVYGNHHIEGKLAFFRGCLGMGFSVSANSVLNYYNNDPKQKILVYFRKTKNTKKVLLSKCKRQSFAGVLFTVLDYDSNKIIENKVVFCYSTVKKFNRRLKSFVVYIKIVDV